jgi:hypothetical protein
MDEQNEKFLKKLLKEEKNSTTKEIDAREN